MSMIAPGVKTGKINIPASWYSRGWEDYDDAIGLREGLNVLHINGESLSMRRDWKRGWRDALVCDLCDTTTAPRWMKQEMGLPVPAIVARAKDE